ncbi:hypothetical protein ACUHMQ_07715 [Chitinimonas sp. PSY-7]|uniref:hypothetical protein n=1 Tax=Chitinimonas sp. PSY-7 TaxID=3459088 RepID=UPI0040400A21
MAKFLRALLLLALVCAGTWGLVILYWQEIHLVPGTEDIVLYLLVLPLAIFFTFLGLNWLWRRRKARLAAPPVAVAAPAANAEPVAASLPMLNVIAAEVATPVGETLGEIADALQAAPVPPLDTELCDPNGFPLVTRRYPDLDLTVLPAAWQHDADNAPLAGRQRALALLASVIDRLEGVLTQLAAAQVPFVRPRQPQRAAELNPAWLGEVTPEPVEMEAAQCVPPLLRVQLLLEPGMDAAAEVVIAPWLNDQLARFGLSTAQLQVEIRPMAVNGLSRHLNAVVDELAVLSQPVVVLLLAAGSSVCQQSLNDGLFSDDAGDRGGIHIPGESAAALLLANTAFELADFPPIAQLGMADLAPCDAIARTRPHAAKVLLNLFGQRTGQRALPVETGWLCSGLGLGPEAAEVASLLTAAPMSLQPNEVVHVRSATGDANMGGRLASYALACQMAVEQGLPTMLVLNDGWVERGLCLIGAAPEPAGANVV